MILAAVGVGTALLGTATGIMGSRKAKKEAKRAEKQAKIDAEIARRAQEEQKAVSVYAHAQAQDSAIKQKAIAGADTASELGKMTERKNRPGQTSLLTGSATGLKSSKSLMTTPAPQQATGATSVAQKVKKQTLGVTAPLGV